jgi:hypothetical protein
MRALAQDALNFGSPSARPVVPTVGRGAQLRIRGLHVVRVVRVDSPHLRDAAGGAGVSHAQNAVG